MSCITNWIASCVMTSHLEWNISAISYDQQYYLFKFYLKIYKKVFSNAIKKYQPYKYHQINKIVQLIDMILYFTCDTWRENILFIFKDINTHFTLENIRYSNIINFSIKIDY